MRKLFKTLCLCILVLVYINYNSATSAGDGDKTPPADVTGLGFATTENSVILTWREPVDKDFAGISISWTPADGGTQPVTANKGTMNKPIGPLIIGKDYMFTIKSVNTANNMSAGVILKASTKHIALFSLGQQDGDFGFGACQTALSTATNLTDRGYTQARFFGSTNTYNFINIATDAQALATTEGTAITGNLAVFTDNTGATAPIRNFGTGNRVVTLANLLGLNTTTGNFQNGGRDVLSALIGTDEATRFWSFSNGSGRYNTVQNCFNATRMMPSNTGQIGSIDELEVVGGSSCDNTRHVLCIAR